MTTTIEAMAVLAMVAIAVALRQIAEALLVVADAVAMPPPTVTEGVSTERHLRALPPPEPVPADPENPYSQSGLSEEEAWEQYRAQHGDMTQDERDAAAEDEARLERTQRTPRRTI